MNISIFGLGQIGIVSAVCFVKEGHQVIGVDNVVSKIEMLNAGISPIQEPEVDDLLKTAVDQKKLRATLDPVDALMGSEISFICVNTPSKPEGIELKHMLAVCESIGTALKQKDDFHVVVIRSTIFPGTIKNSVIPTLEKSSGKISGQDFSVCIYPEFLRTGSSVYDFYHPPKILIGSTDVQGQNILLSLITEKFGTPLLVDLEVAEFSKYCDNSWHALKVGFANEIGNIAKTLGIDSQKVMDVFCTDRILNISPAYLKPGFAFGGSCLIKDLQILIGECDRLDLRLPILASILPSNDLQIERALQLILKQKSTKVGFLGVTFKAKSSDLRESPSLKLINQLLAKNYEVVFYDQYMHSSNTVSELDKIRVDSIEEVLLQAETIVIGNRSKEFSRIQEFATENHTILDLAGVANNKETSTKYFSIC